MKALTVTASILLGALVLVVGWLALFPGPGGDPVVSVAVSPPPPPPKQAPRLQPTPAAQPPADLPAGFGITASPPVPPPQAVPSPVPTTPQPQSAPPSPPPAQQQAGPAPPGAPAPNTQQTAAVPAPQAPQTPLPSPPDTETAAITLVSAPDPALVEESQYGPLPKVAQDGRRPLDVYARPSKYAGGINKKTPPRVAVLVDGLGMSDGATTDAIKGLPAPFSVAYGAYGRNLQDWVVKARDAGHEVILQVPLEPVDYPTNDPGPHTLLTTLPPEENMKRLQWLMSRFTGYVGVTNLMGAKFESDAKAIVPVFEELKARGLLFIDDGTARTAIAAEKSAAATPNTPPSGPASEKVARAIGLDYAIADLQIDATPSPDDIAKALNQLEAIAKQRGVAIGVASGKPATVKQLAQWAGQLQSRGVILIPVSAAIRSQRQS